MEYLRQYDSIVPNIDYTGRMKCFLGIILKVEGDVEYFAPFTSYKPKFQKLKNNIDFLN